MATNLDRYKADLKKLLALGRELLQDLSLEYGDSHGQLSDEQKLAHKKLKVRFDESYQEWYTQSLALVRQLLPERLSELQSLYSGDGRRKLIDRDNYRIQDWLSGVRSGIRYDHQKVFDDVGIAFSLFSMQYKIVASVGTRFESSLHDIQQLVQADLFDSEIAAARALLRSGFLRAAGVIAGVVLERHLAQVLVNHAIGMRKKNPTISDFNDALKSEGVLDVPRWRNIQRLGDLRNLCGHNKEREPTTEEVNELVEGVENTTKSVF